MASIKLDPNKAYRVNFRLLEAAQPSAVKITIGERTVPTAPAPGPGPTTTKTCPTFSGSITEWEGSQIRLRNIPSNRYLVLSVNTNVFPLLQGSTNYRLDVVTVAEIAKYGKLEVFASSCPGQKESSNRCINDPFAATGTVYANLRVKIGTAINQYEAATVCSLPSLPNTGKFYVNFKTIEPGSSGTLDAYINISR